MIVLGQSEATYVVERTVNEVLDAFTDDIMSDASDTAVQFADYVLENHIAVYSKFPPILWSKPPDLLFPYTNNGADSANSVCFHE